MAAESVNSECSVNRPLINRTQALQIQHDDPISQDKPFISTLDYIVKSVVHNQKIVSRAGHTSELASIVAAAGYTSDELASIAAAVRYTSSNLTPTAAADPIDLSDTDRDPWLLIHQHLLASGSVKSASSMFKPVQLEPFPIRNSNFFQSVAPSSLVQQPSTQKTSPIQLHRPSA